MKFVAIFAHADFAGLPNTSYVVETEGEGLAKGPDYAEAAAIAEEKYAREYDESRFVGIVLTEGDLKFYAERVEKRLRKD